MEKQSKPVTKFAKNLRRLAVVKTPVIVSIGSSVDGLEILNNFFSHVKTTCNVVFIVIQQAVNPAHKCILLCRTQAIVIGAVVTTFIDISEAKLLESELHKVKPTT